MLIKIPIYFDISGNPSTEILKEFIKDTQLSVSIYLSNDELFIDTMNDSRESESFPLIDQVVGYGDMMSRILKPKPVILHEPKKVPVVRKPSRVKKK